MNEEHQNGLDLPREFEMRNAYTILAKKKLNRNAFARENDKEM